MEKSDPNI